MKKDPLKYRFFSLIFAPFLFISCSASYNLETNPSKAVVFNGNKNIGETPIEFSTSDLEGEQGGGYFLRLEKPGYKRVWLWIPGSGYQRDLKVNMNPFFVQNNQSKNAMSHQISPQKLNQLTDKMLKLQTDLMLGKSVDDKEIENLLKTNPYLASSHFLAGLQAISKKDQNKSVEYLKDAVRFNKMEEDFQILLNEFESNKNPTP